MVKAIGTVFSSLSHLIHQFYLFPCRTLEAFWDFSRCYFYALAFWSLFCAKFLHLYAHIHSLPPSKLVAWGITFYFQDVVILLLLRVFAQKSHTRSRLRVALDVLVVVPFSLIVSVMAAANFSVYVFTGAEIHWRQAKSFTGDTAAIRTLLTGLTGFLIGEVLLSMIAVISARPIHTLSGGILHVLAWPFQWLLPRLRPYVKRPLQRLRKRNQQSALPDPEIYERIALEDDYLNDSSDDDESDFLIGAPAGGSSQELGRVTERTLPRALMLAAFCLFVVLRLCRPSDPMYWYLSGSLPMASLFEGGHHESPVNVEGIPSHYGYLNAASSLRPPPAFGWMPSEAAPGFEDWNKSDTYALHYNSEIAPLHISNLDQPVLEPVRRALADGHVKIKHVVLLKLESARADIFPLRKDSFMFERIAESWKDKVIPEDALQRIANLTPTAEYLTGFPTGFDDGNTSQPEKKPYGGLSAKNAYTTSTYTLKSLAGTLCGVTPLVADFNREWEHHIYQPCLPHVFNMLSQQPGITKETDDFAKWPFHSVWMQSVTEGYDNQDKLTPVLGFEDKKTKEIIESPDAKHPVKGEEVNYYGYADTELEDYIRDAIDNAERDHERLFLTHLTGTTHHPWGLPGDEYSQILGSQNGQNEDLNRYLNAVGFVDAWLATILGILQEKGVANETLVVMAGDHGLSLPNDGGITPYDNPHVGNFHVPIVFAHPQLPPVEISAPVMSDQIVPSIIDLLIESSSLSETTTPVARDIRSLYEGQSLIRPLIQEKDGKQDWQFTVMNTGGSWLSVRSAAKPQFRLVIPLVNDVEWRFSDLNEDPNEDRPVSRFSLLDLAETIRKKYDQEVLHWLWDAAYVSNWWVGENWHRYRYVPGK
ncbi:uncharacterized protein N7482_010533 [Penicillium canariense]|uniref:Sulfatase N-terminal domain-containing protein n=1 Tax=Penicillium canariense TaxID=189055 RepID=A0A9W9LD15_9EURO|nr:uncharacterized protein N7482_010533 [Penicillium canariense]KAJ5151281.1 hypothetical protein N7482_010533 [Penicillium canariense]